MKTRKVLAAMMVASFTLSIATASFAQSATSGTPKAAPATPAAKPAAPAASAKPAAKPAATGAKAATAASAKASKEAELPRVGGTPKSIVGEVVDPACWIVNGAKGAAHKDCAIACAKAGQVLAICESKTQKLYMVATDKPGEDPNKGLIDYVGQMVLVKGRVYTRGGATGIKVTSVEPYSATGTVAQ